MDVCGDQEMLARDIDPVKVMSAGGGEAFIWWQKCANKIDAKKGAAALQSKELEDNTGR